MKKPIVKAEISYGDLTSLIYILSEPACEAFGLDPEEWADMPLGKFTEYLESMPSKLIVQLIEENPIAYSKEKGASCLKCVKDENRL